MLASLNPLSDRKTLDKVESESKPVEEEHRL